MTACPSENELAAFLDGHAEPALRRHLGDCASCRSLTGELLRSLSPAVAAPEPGRIIGSYELGAELGRGGMGVVFRATDLRLRRPVAIKFLAARLLGDVDAVLRFRREAQAVAGLRHPNVAALFEAGESDGLHYLVFELVDGMPLTERIGKSPMAEKDALPILIQLASGVAAAHAGGIVHRDLKPSNVMVQFDGAIKLLDFGLAKLTDEVAHSIERITLTKEVLGTLAYMAPEQQAGRADDPRVDLWAIGAVAYHMLAGKPPFGFSPADIARAQVTYQLAPLRNVSPDLATLVMRCLSEDANQRPATAQLVADDLGRIARGEPTLTRPTSVTYRLRKSLGRHRALTAVSLVALVAIVSLGVYGLNVRRHANERARLARELGRGAQQIRSTLRNAHLMPLHDTRPERATVATQMKQIEDEMRGAGREGQGPGNAALGEGWEALGDFAQARTHLEAAWSAGERGPDLAAALGFTLATIYDDEAQRARHLPDAKARQQQKEELDRTLRDPALLYLRAATGANDTTPGYVAARIALLERDYARALSLAEQAFAQSQSLYEAGIVEAAALYGLGREAWSKENGHAKARELWGRMRSVDDRVLDIARSDEAAYQTIARAELDTAIFFALERTDASALELRIVAMAEHAVTARPDLAPAQEFLGRVLYVRGQNALDLNRDPRPFVQPSVAASRRALALDPDDSVAVRQVGNASYLVGVWRQMHGQDPERDFAEASVWHEQSLKMRADTDTYRALGVTLGSLADWQAAHGNNPIPTCERAIALQEQARARNEDRDRETSIAGLLTIEAGYLDRSGGDPLPTQARAIEGFRKAAPKDGLWETRAYLADAYCDQALYRLKRGLALGIELREAHSEIAKARPEGAAPYYFTVVQKLALVEALAALLDGKDCRPWEAQVTKAGAEAHAADPTYAFAPRWNAEMALLSARADVQHGTSPEAALRRARVAMDQAVKLNSSDSDSLVTAAEVRRRLAEGAQSHHHSPDADLAAANALLDRATHDTPRIARARAERAALLRIAALANHDAALAERANAELVAARAIDPLVDFIDVRLAAK